MTKRAKIIIGVVIAALLALGVAAGMVVSNGVSSTKSSNQIKGDIEKALAGKDYFETVEVTTYQGPTEEEDADAPADSAGIVLSLNKMDAATFKEVASLLPKLEMPAFYSIGDSDDIENITTVTGFKSDNLADPATVEAIAASLKVQEEYKGSFWQVSLGNAEGDDASKFKTQFVAKEDKVAEIRKTVDAVLTAKMDVLPVAKTDLSEGSFTQFAAVDGKMENYNAGLELGLKFADEVFLEGEQVVLLGLGDDIQISYTSLRKGLDNDKLTEIAKNLNKDQLFKITVVDPADIPEEGTATESAEPEETEPSASPSEEAAPSESADN